MSHCSSANCAEVMSKRTHEDAGEERVTAKSKPMMNFVLLFSQEWKSDEMLEARTGRPVSEQPAGSFTQHTDKFVIDDDCMLSRFIC